MSLLTIFALRILFLVLLYGFLLLVAYLVWRDLQTRSVVTSTGGGNVSIEPTLDGQRGGRLTVIASGERGLPLNRQFRLETVTTIGRDPSNDIVITDAFASSQHARIERRENRHWLEDLGSRNGTLFNNNRIAPHEPVPLDPGDVITIGKTQFKVG